MNSSIKQIIKKIGVAVFGFALIAQIFFADVVLASGTPVFKSDLATLRVANKTDGDTTWSSSVSANPGDRIAFDVYYRNSTGGSTAKNTKVKIVFPTSVQNQITSTGYISADNASTISGTAAINLGSQTAKLTFSDTGLWYANKSQTGTDISVARGSGTAEVNIGDIGGSCDNQGHVVFFATLSEIVSNPNLTITKSVRNITDGQTSYTSSVSADPGERVGYKIVITSNGQTAANNVSVSDTLPSNLIYRDNLNVSSGYSSGDITSGINLGTINSGSSATITFEADVQSSSYFSNGTVTLTNTAYASATGVSQVQASANVSVYNNVIANDPNLTITKSVRNITDGQTSYSSSANANPGERVGYKIVITSSGQTAANNVYVSDTLPSGLIYQNNLSVSSGYSSGDITSGINLGTINSGSSMTITFEADIQSDSYFGSGTATLTNYAYASATNVSQKQASASVYVANTVVNNPNLTITKSVRNITDGQSYYSNSISATPGERVGYKIVITSSGQTAASNVYVSDTLPSGLIYENNLNVSSGYSSGDITSGINLGTVYNGNAVTITFEADIQSDSYFGSGTATLTNYAYASATGVSQVQDSAIVNVYNNIVANNPNLTITKSVKNITDGQSYYSNSVSATPGERIGFKIEVSSNGQTAATNVYVRDVLPSSLIYRDNLSVSSGYSSGDITSGINLGTVYNGNVVTITFETDVQSASYFNSGTVTMTNTAYASASNVSQRQATANVNVTNGTNVVQSSAFTINKMVRNISKGETGWQNSVAADPGDQVEFYLNVTNTGSTAVSGLYIKDTLPVKMTYLGNVKMDGYYNSGNVVSAAGIYIGDLSAGQSRVVIFQAQVLGETEFNFGSTNVVNTATVYNASNSAIDSAIVVVNKRAVAGAETEVNTGLKEDLMSYLLLPALLAIGLMFVFRNQLFKVDKWLAVRGADNRVYHSQRILDQKINRIREKENRK